MSRNESMYNASDRIVLKQPPGVRVMFVIGATAAAILSVYMLAWPQPYSDSMAAAVALVAFLLCPSLLVIAFRTRIEVFSEGVRFIGFWRTEVQFSEIRRIHMQEHSMGLKSRYTWSYLYGSYENFEKACSAISQRLSKYDDIVITGDEDVIKAYFPGRQDAETPYPTACCGFMT